MLTPTTLAHLPRQQLTAYLNNSQDYQQLARLSTTRKIINKQTGFGKQSIMEPPEKTAEQLLDELPKEDLYQIMDYFREEIPMEGLIDDCPEATTVVTTGGFADVRATCFSHSLQTISNSLQVFHRRSKK